MRVPQVDGRRSQFGGRRTGQRGRCAVSHGGAGTTLGALAHGLPHLVMPGGAPSQQRNAATTERLGLGLSVSQDAPPEQLRDAARRLLTDQSYRAAGRAAAATLERLPSIDECVSLIEGLA